MSPYLRLCQLPKAFQIARNCKTKDIPEIIAISTERHYFHVLHGVLDSCFKKFERQHDPNMLIVATKVIDFLIRHDEFPRYMQNFVGPNLYRSKIVNLLCKVKMKPVSWTSNLFEKSVTIMRFQLQNNREIIEKSAYYKQCPLHFKENYKLMQASDCLIRDTVFDVNRYYRYYVSSIYAGHFRDVIVYYHNSIMTTKITMEDIQDTFELNTVLAQIKSTTDKLVLNENDFAFHIISWSTILATLDRKLQYHPTINILHGLFICMEAIQSLFENAKNIHKTSFLHAAGYFYDIKRVHIYSSLILRNLYHPHLEISMQEVFRRYEIFYTVLQQNISKLNDFQIESVVQRFIDVQFNALDFNYKLSLLQMRLPNVSPDWFLEINENSSSYELRFSIRILTGHCKKKRDAPLLLECLKSLMKRKVALSPSEIWYYALNQLSYYPSDGLLLRELYQYIVETYKEKEILIGSCTFLYLRGLVKINPKLVQNWLLQFKLNSPLNAQRIVKLMNKLKLQGCIIDPRLELDVPPTVPQRHKRKRNRHIDVK